jgi:hypothetical protein
VKLITVKFDVAGSPRKRAMTARVLSLRLLPSILMKDLVTEIRAVPQNEASKKCHHNIFEASWSLIPYVG